MHIKILGPGCANCVTLERVTDPRQISEAGLNKPFARTTFDVVLTRERAEAPSTVVAREHVVAA